MDSSSQARHAYCSSAVHAARCARYAAAIILLLACATSASSLDFLGSLEEAINDYLQRSLDQRSHYFHRYGTAKKEFADLPAPYHRRHAIETGAGASAWVQNMAAGRKNVKADAKVPFVNPFSVPLREPCNAPTTKSSKHSSNSHARTRKIFQLHKQQEHCYMGAVITFDNGDLMNSKAPFDAMDYHDGFIWLNFGFLNTPMFEAVFPPKIHGSTGLHPGTVSGHFVAVPEYLPRLVPSTFGYVVNGGSFTLVSMYLTSLFYDDVSVTITANTGVTKTVKLSATKPTLVVFGHDFKDIVFVDMIATTASDQGKPHKGYFQYMKDAYYAMDNVHVLLGK